MVERAAIVPSVFYRDPLAALKWLEAAFGFETVTLLTDAEGQLAHSEMAFRGASLSVSGEFGGDLLGGVQMKSPQNLGGSGSQFLRVELDTGIDAHCERARAAGARITAEPETQFYGARVYRALDLEGHVWNFTQEVSEPTVAEMEAATGLTFRTLDGGPAHG